MNDVRALDPLPPLSKERTQRWPRLERLGLCWLPHACVLLIALFTGVGAFGPYFYGTLSSLLLAFAIAAPTVLTLFRPKAAYWVSLAVLVLSTLYGTWSGPVLFAHVSVMVLTTLRSKPRVALEMWVISLAAASLTEILFLDSLRVHSEVVPLAFIGALSLGTAAAIRAWWLARSKAEEQETLVADVRGQRTQLEERARIARELHDVVAHHMSVIAIQAEAAPYRVKDVPAELTSSFATIRESAVIALAELRRVLGVLRLADQDTGLPDAPQPDLSRLGELIDGVRAVGTEVDLVESGAKRELPQGVELSAYRIVQEALSNVLRHAPGAQVRVETAYVLTGLGLRVVNTAPTGEAQPSPGVGQGVPGMRERATMLGGELTAEPTAEGGYQVLAFLPADQGERT